MICTRLNYDDCAGPPAPTTHARGRGQRQHARNAHARRNNTKTALSAVTMLRANTHARPATRTRARFQPDARESHTPRQRG
eukprot:1045364-Lingulodinium_polyedra.AAC.1